MRLRDGLAALAIVLLGLAGWQWLRAREAGAEVDRLEAVRDSAVAVADSLGEFADSAKAARDALRETLSARTDSLEDVIGRLAAERTPVSGEQVAVGDSLGETLQRIRAAVGTGLVAVVDTAIGQHERERALDRTEDALYEQELAARAELLATARAERDSWKADWEDEHAARLAAEQASTAKDSLIAVLQRPDPLTLELPFGLEAKPCIGAGIDTRGKPNAVAGACVG